MKRLLVIAIGVVAAVGLVAAAAHAASPFDHGQAAPTAGVHVHGPWAQALFQAQAALSARFNLALIELRDARGPGPVLAALGAAFLYGCLHAAGPGHGKALVSGYLVSRDATVGDVLRLGTQIAVMHVASAVVLVTVLALFVRNAFTSPEDLRGVQIASDVVIVGIGAVLFARALRARTRHDHGHGHSSTCGCAAHVTSPRTGWLTAFGAGIVPCSGTMITLVFALGNGILLAGIGMLLAIALGMSVTLIAIGSIALASRRAATVGGGFTRRPHIHRLLDFGGPSFIILAGGTLLIVALAAS